ncbi:hypothetical protein PIB30_041624 [Stylosanthes scabra]|uniref:Transposase MuDR plant domain-containing protein n=1 Tax=Stylosanthes scabra TaxID=79078 RepID=A0ABU6XF49_9FABA|nr:hypothetical protein [Stylosanthes scabra]
MRMKKFLVAQDVKHCVVYVVDGFRKGNGIEITSTDDDYVPSEEDYVGSGDGLIEVKIEGESEASRADEKFDDSADDGRWQRRVLGAENESVDDEGVGDDADGEDVDAGEISSGYKTEDIDSYEGDYDGMMKKKRYLKYTEAKMHKDYRFQVGLEFTSIAQFRDAIK